MKIISVPIEGFEERYSIQWRSWFSNYMGENDIPFFEVYPDPLKEERETGAFLDICGTNYFKAMQLACISQLVNEGVIEDGDVFLFHDLWFPGLEMLAYMRDALGIKFKITGCLHAGTWDSHDFITKTGMRRWAAYVEQGWIALVDAVFVATEFHKDLMRTYFEKGMPKVHVTGFPIYPVSKFGLQRERKVVFPHRLDEEKNPHMFDALASAYEGIYGGGDGVEFVKTKVKCKTKEEYYKELATSAVSISFADQETWGIAMIESTLCGCVPLVPNRLSYRELYPAQFKYNYDFSDSNHFNLLADDIHKMLDCEKDLELAHDLKKKFLLKGSLAIPRMIETIMDL